MQEFRLLTFLLLLLMQVSHLPEAFSYMDPQAQARQWLDEP